MLSQMEGGPEVRACKGRTMPHTCNICKCVATDTNKLKKCSRCHAVWYCGADHQKEDWQHHRDMCRAITTLRQQPIPSDIKTLRSLVGDVEYPLSEAGVRFTLQKRLQQRLVQRILGRKLRRNEAELIVFQDKCVVCYEGGIHSPSNRTEPVALFPCKSCHLVSWCKEHQGDAVSKVQHRAACESYQLFRECERYAARTGEPFMMKEYEPEACYQPLPPDWHSFFRQKCGGVEQDPVEVALLSSYLSVPITLLYALERVLGQEKLSKAKKLCVHLMGATPGSEYACPDKYLEVMHCLPALDLLHLSMIGPDAGHKIMEDITLACKNAEGEESRYLHITCHATYYHDFSAQHCARPDIAIAINAGLHELPFPGAWNSWLPTLLLLVNEEVPTVLTTFTKEELQRDLEVAAKADAKITIHGELNPWRCLHPFLEPEQDNLFFHINNYVWAFHGRK